MYMSRAGIGDECVCACIISVYVCVVYMVPVADCELGRGPGDRTASVPCQVADLSVGAAARVDESLGE